MSGQVDQIVEVDITATSAQPTRGNFGTGLFLQYHTHNTDKVRTYSQPSDLLSDGFTANDPAYKWATRYVSQNPHPPTFKIGRGTTAVAQHFTFDVQNHADGDVVGLTLLDPSGASHACYHTASSETAAQVATAVATLIAALSGVTSSVAVGTVITTIITTAGDIWFPSAMQGGNYEDTTATSNPGTDLDAIRLVDDDFYGVTGAIMSDADITDVAVWVGANTKTHYYTTPGSSNKIGTSAGIMHALKLAGYKRSYGQYSGQPVEYGATGTEALEFTFDPGTYTDAFKELEGVTSDTLTPTQRTNLTTNNGNYYTNIGGVICTFDGRSAQGQYMDLTRFIDALQNDIQIRVFTLLVNLPKVPYDQLGYGMIGAEISASLASFVLTGALSNDPGFEPKVTIPDIGLASTADRQARIARGFKFQCLYTDAIQSVIIKGTVNV